MRDAWVFDGKGVTIDTNESVPRFDVFAALYRQHFGLVTTVILGRVSDIDEAEDLAMAVSELAWTRFRLGEEIGLPWLYRCARNVVGNEYQRRDRDRRLQLRLVSDYDVNALVFPVERDVELVAAVRRLPLVDREVVAMVYWYDLSLKEVGEILGASEASVKMRVSRIRKKLRAHLTATRVSSGEVNVSGQP